MIYFDNAATSFIKPDSVYKKVYEVMRLYAGNPGRSGHRLSMAANDIIYNAREVVANFFGISSPDRVCFTNNATSALNYAIKGVVNKGDKVLISGYEHNSVIRPLHAIGADVEIMNFRKADDELPEVTNNIKMIIVNHMSNVNGDIADIGIIGQFAKKNNIIFMVDASQSAGHLEIDVEKNRIDILACSGHKGLLGPQGTGVLYIRDGIDVQSTIEGGTGSFSEKTTQPDVFPDIFEAGTLNVACISGLMEGVNYINSYGLRKKILQENLLAESLINGLEKIPKVELYNNSNKCNRGTVVSFNVQGWDCVTLSNYLSEKYDICVRGGLHCAPIAHKTIGTENVGTVRVGLSHFNTISEINHFLNVIDKTTKMM